MPGSFPAGYDICNGQNAGAAAGTSKGAVVTASGSINTKGTYTALIASTAFDCCFAVVQVINTATSLVLVDIAVGAAASENVIIPNIFSGTTAAAACRCSLSVALPLSIPAGTRISSRCQSATASDVANVSMILYDGAFPMLEGIAGYDDLGTSLAASTGTAVTPSATANTMGTWTSLVASTTRDYMGLWGTIGMGTISVGYLTNIGIGGSGSQQIIIPSLAQFNTNATSTQSGATMPFLPIQIPKGTNIWAQNQSSGASSAAQNILLYGAYQ